MQRVALLVAGLLTGICAAPAQTSFQKQLDGLGGLFCLEQTADSSYWIGTFLGKILHFRPDGTLQNAWAVKKGDTTSSRFIYDLERAPGGGLWALYDRTNANTQLDDHLILARLNAAGQPLWQTSVYYGEVLHWAHNRVVSDPAGNTWVSSVRLSQLGSDPGEPSRIILSRVDANGQRQWTKAYSNAGKHFPRALNRLADGSLLLSGNGQLSTPYGFLLRLSPDGTVLWGKRYNRLLFKALVELPDGSWAAVATESGPLPQAVCALRLDADGNILWARRLVMPYALNWIPGLALGADGNILLFNYETVPDTPVPDLVCLSPEGDFRWARRYDACHNFGIAAGIRTLDGGIAGIRFRAAGHLFLKTDAQGQCASCPAQAVSVALEPLSDTPLPSTWQSAAWPDPPLADANLLPFQLSVRDFCDPGHPITGIEWPTDTLCTAEPLLASAAGPGPADAYQWTFPGGQPAQSPQGPASGAVWFAAPGTVPVSLQVKYGFCRDTFVRVLAVQPGPAPFSLGPDTTLCGLQNTLNLDATTPGATAYHWSDGASGPARDISAAGTYAVTASAGACLTADTIQVNFLENLPVDIGQDTTLCATDSLWLDATTPGAQGYLWQDKQETPRRLVTTSGFYAVTVFRDGCNGSDFVSVKLLPRPPALPRDTVLCFGEPLVLDVGQSLDGNIFWNGRPGFATFTFDSSGTVYRRVEYRHCRFEDSMYVRRAPCRDGFALYAPNVFSPNGDGRNDAFELFGDGLDVLELRIFDRWGNQVSVAAPRWDGLTKGQNAPPGVYVWCARLRQRGRAGWLTGDVLLLR